MELKRELESWQERLQKDTASLKLCKKKIATDDNVPGPVKNRFNDIIQSLKTNVHDLGNKIADLRRSNLPYKELNTRVERLRTQYNAALLNIDKLLSTANFNTPRPPLQKIGNSKPRGTSIGEDLDLKIEEDLLAKKDLFEFEPAHRALSREFTELKSVVKRVKEQVEGHRHQDIEDRLRELQSDNDDLRSKYATLQHEHNDLMHSYDIMRSKLDKYEADHQKLMSLLTETDRMSQPVPPQMRIPEMVESRQTLSIGDSASKVDRYLLRNTHEAESFLIKKSEKSKFDD